MSSESNESNEPSEQDGSSELSESSDRNPSGATDATDAFDAACHPLPPVPPLPGKTRDETLAIAHQHVEQGLAIMERRRAERIAAGENPPEIKRDAMTKALACLVGGLAERRDESA